MAAAATVLVVAVAGALAVWQRDVPVDVPVPDPTAWFVPVQATSALIWTAASLFVAQRRDLVWWKLAAVAAMSHAVAALAFAWAVRGLVTGAVAPGAEIAAALPGMLLPIEMPVMVYMLVSLPTGRLARVGLDRWGWLAIALAIAGVVLGAVSAPDTEGTDFDRADNPLSVGVRSNIAVPLLIAGGALTAVVVLVVRWRRSSGWDRLAMRWVVWIHVVSTIVVVPVIALTPSGLGVGIAQLASAIGLLAMVTVIRRQRLLGVERVLERTLQFVLLAVSLAVVYAVVIAVGSELVDGAAARPIAAAAVALAVLPLRDRLDRAVARFVYGDRANSTQIVRRIADATASARAPLDLLERALEDLRLGTGSRRAAVELDGYGVIASIGDRSPEGSARIVALQHHGSEIGRLVLGPAVGETTVDPLAERVAGDVAPHLALLADAYRNHVELTRAQARLIGAREEERRRLRHDLHDGLGPILTGAGFSADAASNLVENDPVAAVSLIRATRREIGTAIGEIRRIVEDLRPPALDEFGLIGAIRQVSHRFPQLDVTVAEMIETTAADDPLALPASTEVAAYRIATEALTNVARHAGATSVTVEICVNGDMTLTVTDNGAGVRAWQPGVGLTSMRDRAVEVGGDLSAGPDPAGGGRVVATFPAGAP